MEFLRKLKDVFLSSLPLFVIMVAVCVFFAPLPAEGMIKLFIGYVLAILGQVFFLVGLDNSILPIGKLVGGSLVKLKKVIFIILFGFIFGLLATVAEPAIAVTASQVFEITNGIINFTSFLFVVGAGVGIFVALALFRIIKDFSIKWCFFVFYLLIFIFIFCMPNGRFIALAFDASGATTGDVSVPFILALGLGVSSTLAKSRSSDDSFGIVGLASIGPIITVLVMGIFTESASGGIFETGAGLNFGEIVLSNLLPCAVAIAPIMLIFFMFQFVFLKLPKKKLMRIFVSGVIVYSGLLIFLTGVTFGFELAGKHIGEVFVNPLYGDWFKWLLLPLGFVLGFSIVLSEPAVRVLGEQVEEITNGRIKRRAIMTAIAIGVGIASLFALLRVLVEGDILWFLFPMYVVALILLIFTPSIFVGLGFDSGGVTGGAISTAFFTPLALGLSGALGQDILEFGFGSMAMVSVMPIIAIEVLGIIYNVSLKRVSAEARMEIMRELMHIGINAGKMSARKMNIRKSKVGRIAVKPGKKIKEDKSGND